jgi:hypothetical protein
MPKAAGRIGQLRIVRTHWRSLPWPEAPPGHFATFANQDCMAVSCRPKRGTLLDTEGLPVTDFPKLTQLKPGELRLS